MTLKYNDSVSHPDLRPELIWRRGAPGGSGLQTESTMRFVFPHSHAFPSGRVTVDGDPQAAPECLVEFGDGVNVIADYRLSGDAIHLSIPAYRTAKGTRVAPKRWRLVRGKNGEWRSERAP